MPATDTVSKTEALIDFAVKQVRTIQGLENTDVFPGTNEEALFDYVPEIGDPGAAIVYSGSGWGYQPRRTAQIAVVVGVTCTDAADKVTARSYIDKVVSVLDEFIFEHARFKVKSDRGIDFPKRPMVAYYMIVFDVIDH